MDAALAPRAYNAVAPVTPRADVTPVRAAVPTLLPQPNQSVAASIDSQAGRFRSRSENPLSDIVLREVEREMEFDEEAHEIVSRTLDTRTGRVVNQFPADQILKLRAYVQAEAAKTEKPAPQVLAEA
jgi:hypothetical protein